MIFQHPVVKIIEAILWLFGKVNVFFFYFDTFYKVIAKISSKIGRKFEIFSKIRRLKNEIKSNFRQSFPTNLGSSETAFDFALSKGENIFKSEAGTPKKWPKSRCIFIRNYSIPLNNFKIWDFKKNFFCSPLISNYGRIETLCTGGLKN